MIKAKYINSVIFFFLLSSCEFKSKLNEIEANNQTDDSSIIGGIAAQEEEFPFLVNIWTNLPKQQDVAHKCGGSLISKNWVLTAGHCIFVEDNNEKLRILKPNELILYVGSNKLNGFGGRQLKIKSIILHPQYSWPYNDFALIELKEPQLDVLPINLNQHDFDESSLESQSGQIAGWGLIDAAGTTEAQITQKITLPLITRKKCQEDPLTQKRGWTIGKSILCADTSFSQKSSCAGDSGGPLFQNKNGQFTLLGVVSWGAACLGSYRPANHSSAAGYSNVSEAYSWIQSEITKDSPL